MHDDDPDDVVHNLFAAQAWGDGPLGRPIAGTAESIAALTRDQVGALLPAPLPRRPTSSWPRPATSTTPPSYDGSARRSAAPASSPATSRPSYRGRSSRLRRVHPGTARPERPLRAGQPGARHERAHPPRRPPLRARRAQHRARRRHVLAALPGGPRAARPGLLGLLLRQPTTTTPAWSASRSAACPASSTRCSRPSAHELARVAADGITEEELARGKGQLRGGLVLGLEDSGSRMSRLGKAELVYDELLSLDDVLDRVDAVTRDEVPELAAELFGQPEILAVVGPSLARPRRAVSSRMQRQPAPRASSARSDGSPAYLDETSSCRHPAAVSAGR